MKKTKVRKEGYVSVGKVFAWNMRPIALGAIVIVFGYLSQFCTDYLGIAPATIGLVLMLSKIFDGVTDIFAGFLIDNTNTKLGKARPYELSIIGAWLCTLLLFNAPAEWAYTVKVIWVFVMYSLVWSVFSTLLNAAETPYLIRAFKDKVAMTKALSFGGVIISLGCMVVSISFPILMGRMAVNQNGWGSLMLIYTIPLIVIGLLRFIFVKEEVKIEGQTQEKISIKDIIKVLKTNKYAWICGGIKAVPPILTGMTVAAYYFTRVVGDISKFGILQMFGMLSLFIMMVFPALMKRMVVSKLISIGCIIGIIGFSINFFAGANMPVLIVAFLMTGFAIMPISYLSGLMIMDVSKYNRYKGMQGMEATIASVANFVGKVGSALGSALMGVLLGIAGYVGTADAQPDSAILMIRILYSFIPATVLFMALILARMFGQLDKQMPEIDKVLAERDAATSNEQ